MKVIFLSVFSLWTANCFYGGYLACKMFDQLSSTGRKKNILAGGGCNGTKRDYFLAGLTLSMVLPVAGNIKLRSNINERIG